MKRLKGLWRVYRTPIVVVGILLITLFAIFQGKLLASLCGKLTDPAWWVDNMISVILFPVVTALLVSISQRAHEREQREPYEGWTWKIIRDDGSVETDKIFWLDAERYINSPIERWRAVKSNITSSGDLNVKNMQAARARKWLIDPMDGFEPGVTPASKEIVVNFSLMGDHFVPRARKSDGEGRGKTEGSGPE